MASAHHDPRQAEIDALEQERRHFRRLWRGAHDGRSGHYYRQFVRATKQQLQLRLEIQRGLA
jgi:hypothetical protein